MAFIVPGVTRFAVNQSLEGRAVVNVLDYRIDTTGSTMSRSEAINNQAESIITEWVNWILPLQVDDISLESVSFVDLNSDDGITGSVSSSDSDTLPLPGLVTDDPIPGNTSVLVTKQTTSARGRRNGRMFLAGASEVQTDAANGNRLSTAAQTGYNSNLSSFLSATNEIDSFGTAFESHMVVVSILTRDTPVPPATVGAPLTGEGNDVNDLVVDTLLATQRRRLRG